VAEAGRVVVVTGAASGIGFALARRFATEGARLVLADRHADVLAEAAAELEAAGADVLAVPTDVSDPDAVDALAAAAVDRFGLVHVVCNNAGIVVGGAAWEIPLADWHRLMDVNLWGVIHGIRSFVPILLGHDEPGHVVNTASMAGVTALAGLGPYVASKHAMVGLSEVLFHDLAAAGAGDRIGVTVVCPGYVPTRIGRDDRRAVVDPPTPGALSADDVAGTVVAAMAEGRFYVFTHEGSTDTVRERADAMITGQAHTRRR
jgi:NAD(P)-dependent dehydrogenase (short-subunit alcohol dehydrogenase family)